MKLFGKRRKTQSNRLVTSASQAITFNRRALLLGTAQGAIGLLLAGRMTYITVAENERYQLLSESNRVNLTLVPPRRGWIIDRNGQPIANNQADYRVDLIRDQIEDVDYTLRELGRLLNLDEETLTRIRSELDDGSAFQPVQVASGLSLSEFSAISVRLPDLPGVSPLNGYRRQYPTGAAVGHLVGYVGTPSREEFEAEDNNRLLLTPGFRIGKDGLEKQFEQTLRGEPGARRVEVTARGQVVQELDTREDVPGDPVQLTIDVGLQHYAARRLGEESGSVIVMDCLTGDLLCMASMPSFDPNSFSDGIGSMEYAMLREDDHVPLRNKSLLGLYPPGSTVKPMVAMALLRAGLSPDDSVNCGGGLRVGNRFFRCWKRGGHGRVDMARGIFQSCDTYFYHFAQQIGMQPIADMARECGMEQEFPLPVNNQFYGTVPDPAWKMRRFEQEWQSYDTVNATIGQGYMLANPLQLAVMAGRLATGQQLIPSLIKSTTRPPPQSMGFDAEHITYVRNAMHDVVYGPGTAGRARLPIPGVELAGKTGTAQVVNLNYGDGRNVPWRFRDHGLFIAFAPFDDPRYAVSVVIEHGGGSGAAYPVARDVLTYLYNQELALENLAALEAGWGGTIEERMARDFAAFRAQQNAPPEAAEPEDESA